MKKEIAIIIKFSHEKKGTRCTISTEELKKMETCAPAYVKVTYKHDDGQQRTALIWMTKEQVMNLTKLT